MTANREVVCTLDFEAGKRSRAAGRADNGVRVEDPAPAASVPYALVPRIARLVALAILFEETVREGRARDYAEIARLGHVTRARMTQIMRLADLAPDIHEYLLLMQPVRGLNERNLRPVTRCVDWKEQRRLFQDMFGIDLTVGFRRSDECPERGIGRAKEQKR